MAVGCVHHDGIHTGAHQSFHTLFSALAHAHRSAHAQTARRVTRCIGEAGLLGDVLHRDQALELERIVDDQDALQLVLVEQRLGLFGRGAVFFVDGDELLARRHDLVDLDVVACLKTQVTASDDANHLAAVAYGESRDAQLLRQLKHLQHRVLWRDHHGITQHAGFIALDLGHVRCLLLRCEVFVHDADAALLGDGDSQACFRHSVHGGGHERQVQLDVAGEFRREGRVLGQDLGVRWHQQHIVEGERFSKKAHEKAPKKGLYPHCPMRCWRRYNRLRSPTLRPSVTKCECCDSSPPSPLNLPA